MKKIILWTLQLFAEESAQGTATGETTSAAEAAVQQTDTGNAPATESREVTKSPDEEFEDLINGQYKEQFQKRTQGIINKRFGQMKNLEAQVEKNKTINEAIAAKYQLDPTDIDALSKAVSEDNSFIEEAAYAENLTVEQYKEKLAGQRAQRELAVYKQREQEAAQEERRRAVAQAIDSEVADIRQKYSDEAFDFWNEYNTNPQFKGMIDARVPIETAYRVLNQDRIIASAQKAVVSQTQKAVTDNIMANGMRPVEGGVKAQPPVSARVDVSSVKSPEDIQKYYEMARQGQDITFR